MYNSQETALRIKNVAKSKKISMELLNSACGLSKNAISQAGKSSDGMKAKNLYVIANYLEVSVDYLLGRTDEPNAIYSISGSNNTQAIDNGNNSQITVTTGEPAKTDTTTAELVKLIQSLPLLKRAEAILYLNNIIKDT